MGITEGLYVRAFLLCGVARNVGELLRLTDIVNRLLLDPAKTSLTLTVFIALERNGDRKRHSLRLVFLDPSGAPINTMLDTMIPAESADSVPIALPLPLDLSEAVPGTYRVVLEIDRRLAAWCPLEILQALPLH